jgi:hypothetical protein
MPTFADSLFLPNLRRAAFTVLRPRVEASRSRRCIGPRDFNSHALSRRPRRRHSSGLPRGRTSLHEGRAANLLRGRLPCRSAPHALPHPSRRELGATALCLHPADGTLAEELMPERPARPAASHVRADLARRRGDDGGSARGEVRGPVASATGPLTSELANGMLSPAQCRRVARDPWLSGPVRTL